MDVSELIYRRATRWLDNAENEQAARDLIRSGLFDEMDIEEAAKFAIDRLSRQLHHDLCGMLEASEKRPEVLTAFSEIVIDAIDYRAVAGVIVDRIKYATLRSFEDFMREADKKASERVRALREKPARAGA